MAIRTKCPQCKKVFSAQEEYLGKKVKCPACGTKAEVMDEASRVEAQKKAKEEATWRKEQEERLELLETLAERDRHTTQSLASEFGVGVDRIRNFNPGAVSRFRKLRALSRFMLLGAYLFFPVVLAGAATTVYWYREQGLEQPGLLSLLMLGWLLLLIFAFFLFKFLGEMSWLLADLGDHQLDVRNLLLDLRDDFERIITGKRTPKEQESKETA